jgi:uncharacterized repeat protein (TIGR01451 family)
LTYTLTVTNTGPDPATGVLNTDTLPLEATLSAVMLSQGSCLGPGAITCNLDALASGADLTVTAVVTPAMAGVMTNTVTVTASEFDPAVLAT